MRDSHNGIVDATFCIWRKHTANRWMHGKIEFPAVPDPDGSESLLSPLDGNPSTYHRWAEDYFDPGEFDHQFHVEFRAVQHVFEHKPLNDEIVRQLNPELSLERLSADVEEIGYPA